MATTTARGGHTPRYLSCHVYRPQVFFPVKYNISEWGKRRPSNEKVLHADRLRKMPGRRLTGVWWNLWKWRWPGLTSHDVCYRCVVVRGYLFQPEKHKMKVFNVVLLLALFDVFNLFIFCMFSLVAVFDNNDRVCTLNALTKHRPFKKKPLLVYFCYVIIYLFKLPQNNKMQPPHYNIVSPEKCSKWRSASISTCQSSLLVTFNLL